jgi:hypothetical protein
MEVVMSKFVIWLVMGTVLVVGVVILCAMDKMPSEVVATLAGVAVSNVFEQQAKKNATP